MKWILLLVLFLNCVSTADEFPPTFITVAANDGIVNSATVDRRVYNLRNSGVEVGYKRYTSAGHGFGTGEESQKNQE